MLPFPLDGNTRLWLTLASGIGLVWVVRRVVSEKKRNPRHLPLPPGPKRLPIVGNLFQIPKAKPWMGYADLCNQYGDLLYLEVLGQSIIILGSRVRAVDLLEKRATNYSDRPTIPMIELMGVEWALPVMQYGPEFKQQRRAFHQGFHLNSLPKFYPMIHEERDNYLRTLKENPSQFYDHTMLFFGTLIMRTTYGFDDPEYNKTLARESAMVNESFAEGSVPGRFLVNNFPILKYVPEWFPGAGFQKHFKEVSENSRRILYSTFEGAQKNFETGQGSTHPSVAAELIEELPQENDPSRAESEAIARRVCGIVYIGGAETTYSSALVIIYALAAYPEIQKKAQEEIDAVLGSDRLPTVEDLSRLPYIHAIIKETGRWYTVGPLGFPHVSVEDDEYDGYFIPKGTTILANSWAIMHDPELFEKPFDFIPERYLKDGKINSSVADTEIAAFGFGRRICPGRHFSNDTLFLFAASLLAAFNVTPAKDEFGQPIPVVLSYGDSTVVKPHRFTCDIIPRHGREHLFH